MIVLNKKDADGVSVFQYWYRCPKCRFAYITDLSRFCAGCGESIRFVETEKREEQDAQATS
jgi:rRNA maturation endonuclease Nob1